MHYIEDIQSYRPVDAQEAADKEAMLRLIDAQHRTILTRENTLVHMTSSGFILNRTLDRTLMIHHRIYNSWGWTGGHADGDSDLLRVAMKEAREETGIQNAVPLGEGIASLDILPVPGHFKHDAYVCAHLHLCAAYLLVGDEDEPVRAKLDENSAVSWLPVGEIAAYCSEALMLPVYEKLLYEARKRV